MTTKKQEKNNLAKVGVIIYSICACVAFFKILMIIPYTADDFMWGGPLGIGWLEKGFKGYNGRYLGSLLSMVIARNIVVKSLIILAVIGLIIYVISLFIKDMRSKFLFIIIASTLIVTMPRDIFAQGIAWSVAFANYVPGILCSLIFLSFTRRLFEEDFSYERKYIPITIALGICGSLFIEHVTVVNFALAVTVVIYTLVRFKKVYTFNVGYLIGTILGSIIMFSNSAYWGNNGLRSITASKLDVMSSHLFGIVYKQLVEYNVALNIILVFLFILLYIRYISKYNKRKVIGLALNIYGVLYCIFSTYIFYTVSIVKYHLGYYQDAPTKLNIVGAILAVLFYIYILLMVIIYLEKKRTKTYGILFTLMVGALAGPLFIVNPCGPRAFTPIFMIYIALVGIIVDAIGRFYGRAKIIIGVIFAGITIGGFVNLYNIYNPMHRLTEARLIVQNYQIEQGDTTLIQPKTIVGNNIYIWNWVPGDNWETQYVTYYGLPKTATITYLGTKTWLDKYSFLLKDYSDLYKIYYSNSVGT